jgi:hypothetical protein
MQKTTVGKIYSDSCYHCNAMEKAWEEMDKRVGGKVEVKKFSTEPDGMKKLEEFNKERGTNIASQNGVPTLFKLKGGNVTYYNGGRSTEELVNWALEQKGGSNKKSKNKRSKKNKNKRNKSQRRR